MERDAVPNEGVLSVSDLTAIIKERLTGDVRLRLCAVTGELSNFKHHTSGHLYFTLKDDRSRIRAVMFSRWARSLSFVPKDGMRVIARGSVGVFERDGQYQLYVEDMQPDGIGALYIAFTQLRDRLAAEGLFAAERKRPLPPYPRRIGVVTSPTGAVLRDICSTLRRRYPLAQVLLAPARVQGEGAAATVVDALRRLERFHTQCSPIDVIIVARGGGSLEELWPFNEEMVARAVAACPVPVISAVGHETDYTICDFAADVRAATPTAAAELAAPHIGEMRVTLQRLDQSARQGLLACVERSRRRLETAAAHTALQHPDKELARRRQLVDYLEGEVMRQVHRPLTLADRRLGGLQVRLHMVQLTGRLGRERARLEAVRERVQSLQQRRIQNLTSMLDTRIAQLTALNPLSVLQRGYTLVYRGEDELVTSAVSAKPGDHLNIRFADGSVPVRVLREEEASSHGITRTRSRESGRAEQVRLDL
ncbi:exodeoxyribonuclease VII large subunit [Alicyclobacillus shizuokensis]|uniref:exodeoxyribonuclease VII large subunit n=1 Tax=Alicyclobacillus shizuokensis TaxID=392014 RepID=UPI0008358C35|nr:exodeoxyribonuclease VII large subunit [Alicyclobacillus shizuokensis]